MLNRGLTKPKGCTPWADTAWGRARRGGVGLLLTTDPGL